MAVVAAPPSCGSNRPKAWSSGNSAGSHSARDAEIPGKTVATARAAAHCFLCSVPVTKLIRTAGGAQKGVRPRRAGLALRLHHLSNRTLLRRLETSPWGRYCCKSPRGVARPGRFGNNRIRI